MPGSRRLLVAKWAEWIGLAMLPILTAIRSVGAPESPTSSLGMLYHDILQAYVPLVALFSIAALAGKAGQAFLGAESKIRVKAILDALEEACFNTVPRGERYYNRVTLFKASWMKTKL